MYEASLVNSLVNPLSHRYIIFSFGPSLLLSIFKHLILTNMEDRMSTSSGTLPVSVSASKERVAASKRKNPPPESIENIRTRSQVVLSFWAIVIFLGLPIWWWTTSIHRARLPLRDMLEWADGKVFSFDLFP